MQENMNIESVKAMEPNLKYPLRKKQSIDNVSFELSGLTQAHSKITSKINSENIAIGTIIEKELHKENINFCKPDFVIENVDGNPDFIIPKYRIAIFCDGDFPHGIKENKVGSNTEFWSAKINRNRESDEVVNNLLKKNGWQVFRFWEHEIINDPQECIKEIKKYIQNIVEKKESKGHLFTFVDLFSGIGGFRVALEEVGGKCLGYSEIDKDAIRVYKRNYIDSSSQEIELGSVTNIHKLPFDVDLIVGGVPCQSWSVAGKMRGFQDPRGQLWYDTLRIVEKNLPKAFIFENVKGLSDPRNKESLNYLLVSFKKIGYKVHFKVLNSYDFGLPQNRERIFIVGIREDLKKATPFVFPKPIGSIPQLKYFIDGIKEETSPEKVVFEPQDLFGSKIPLSRNKFQSLTSLNEFFVFCDTRNGHSTIHSWDILKTTDREKQICMMILKNRRKKIYGNSDGNPISFFELKKLIPDIKEIEMTELVSKKILRTNENGYEFVNSKNSAGINNVYRVYMPDANIFSTLTATGTKDMVSLMQIRANSTDEYREIFINEIYKKKKYRQLMPREIGRLQGFPKCFIMDEKNKIANKQFGNAVSPPVIVHLSKSLLATNIFIDDK